MILVLSCILSLLSVHLFSGCLDDAVTLFHATTGQEVPNWLLWHAWGMDKFIGLLWPYFGRHYDWYRVVFMSINLSGFALLGWIARRSALALWGLSSLLWMPGFYCSFREIRYDGFMILILALNLWMISSC